MAFGEAGILSGFISRSLDELSTYVSEHWKRGVDTGLASSSSLLAERWSCWDGHDIYLFRSTPKCPLCLEIFNNVVSKEIHLGAKHKDAVQLQSLWPAEDVILLPAQGDHRHACKAIVMKRLIKKAYGQLMLGQVGGELHEYFLKLELATLGGFRNNESRFVDIFRRKLPRSTIHDSFKQIEKCWKDSTTNFWKLLRNVGDDVSKF